jgi:hypothetical protein
MVSAASRAASSLVEVSQGAIRRDYLRDASLVIR